MNKCPTKLNTKKNIPRQFTPKTYPTKLPEPLSLADEISHREPTVEDFTEPYSRNRVCAYLTNLN